MASSRVALNAFERIAAGWNLSPREGAELLNVSEATMQHWFEEIEAADVGADVLERISHLVWIWEDLAAVFGDGELARSWVRRPNTDFGEEPPLASMVGGDAEALRFVRAYLREARYGNESYAGTRSGVYGEADRYAAAVRDAWDDESDLSTCDAMTTRRRRESLP